MISLVIDDLRILNLPGEVVYARTVGEALARLESNTFWDGIYVDHDLGYRTGRAEDIWDVVECFETRMFENPIKTRQIYVITANPVGRQRLKLAFDQMGYPTTVLDTSAVLGGILPW